MANFYNTHLRKTSDPTSIRKNQMERGMVVKIKYRRGGTIPKLYLVFVLQPRWPQTSDGKLHGLSLDNVLVLELNLLTPVILPNSGLSSTNFSRYCLIIRLEKRRLVG